MPTGKVLLNSQGNKRFRVEQADFKNIQDIRFSNYLSSLDSLKADDLNNIDILLNKYPYCQLLYLLGVKAAVNTPQYQTKLAQAATIIPSRNVLYDIIHHPEKFSLSENDINENTIPFKEQEEDALISIIDEEQELPDAEKHQETVEEEAALEEGNVHVQEIQEEFQEIESKSSEPEKEQFSYDHDDEVFEEITPFINPEFTLKAESTESDTNENLDLENEAFSETILEEENNNNETLASFETEDQGAIIEEVNNINNQEEEIEENEIDLASPEKKEKEKPHQEEKEPSSENISFNTIENIEDEETFEISLTNSIQEEYLAPEEQTDDLAQKESVSLSSEDNLTQEQNHTITEELKSAADQEINYLSETQKTENQENKKEIAIVSNKNVSTYNDERLPYTFLWWLSKTRNEYENTRPYASFKLDTTQEIKSNDLDALNHQIAENIFHFQSSEDIAKNTHSYTVPFDFRKKEHQIIEKFIKEEPQIKPPVATKIDTENKAKKSSQDTQELVSETLAKVYVEQMLFHKALEVYKKLSLKYPEKSTYFASQIKYLELKVN